MSFRILDLYCGAGGASVGYNRAGFEVVGVDHKAQRHYPYDFLRSDCLTFLSDFIEAGGHRGFDAIHASPPCQMWSAQSSQHGEGSLGWQRRKVRDVEHIDLISFTRALLEEAGLPFIIENVPQAPLVNPITLCGVTFPELRVIRHRSFELGGWDYDRSTTPSCGSKNNRDGVHPTVMHPYDMRRKKRTGDEFTEYLSITGGGHSSLAAAEDAMGIDWMSRRELVQAIPPAYTEWLGGRLANFLRS